MNDLIGLIGEGAGYVGEKISSAYPHYILRDMITA